MTPDQIINRQLHALRNVNLANGIYNVARQIKTMAKKGFDANGVGAKVQLSKIIDHCEMIQRQAFEAMQNGEKEILNNTD